MGRLKMLLPFGDRPMLARVIESLRATATIGPITVVLGHAEQEIRRVVSEYADVSCVTNAAYAEGGMLSSVKAGVGALPADAAAWFLVLGDQPMVWPPTLEALIGCWEPDRPRIVIPSYRGRRGLPVLIPRSLAA